MEYTKAPINILEMSISEIQEAVDLGLVNYETIAKIYLERIQEYNDEFDAIISVNENIIEQAKKLDDQYKESGRTSMLFRNTYCNKRQYRLCRIANDCRSYRTFR